MTGQRMTHRSRGFTLIELLIVIAILSLIAVLAVGAVTSRSGAADRAAIAVLQNTVKRAQTQARRDESHVISLATGGSHISVYRDGSELTAYSANLPPGYSLSSSAPIVQADGSLNGPITLSLANGEVSYVLYVERSGVLHL